MSASYPTTVKSFNTKTDNVTTNSAAHINDLQDEVVALETDLLQGWTTYTPTWTASVNPAIGNGTLSGQYRQIGKIVLYNITMTAGSGTTFGTGEWHFALPVTASGGAAGSAVLADASTAYYSATTLIQAGTLVIVTNAVLSFVSPTVPFTWASLDGLQLTGFYVAA